jgi:hypothetical protein
VSDREAKLLETGREAVAAVTRTLFHHGTAVQCQLLASTFYETLRFELELIPGHELERRQAFSAALAQCEEAALPSATPLFILARLKAAVALLEGLSSQRTSQPRVPDGAPRLRVVQGGRA